MPYTFLENVTADIAFQAEEESLEALFRTCGDAVTNTMVEDLNTLRFLEIRTIELSHEQLDLLLFDFLQEFIYFKDAEQLLLRASQLSISKENSHYRLKALLRGEALDPPRHEQRIDVKAVTLHQFRLEKVSNGWMAHVILDI